MMRKQWLLLGCFAMTCTLSAMAQTAVTTPGGTTNTIPVFTGNSTVGSSVITQANGNVGIGTTNPTGTLVVAGGTAAASTNGTNIKITAQSAGTGNQNGGNIYLTPGAASGTGTPGSIILGLNQLQFDYYRHFIQMISSPIGSGQWMVFSNTSGGNPTGAFSFRNETPTDLFTILMSGNVGVGTTAPGAKLEVNGGVKLTSGSTGGITFADGTKQTTAYTGSLPGVTDTSGDLGIGTTSPTQKLSVNGSISATTGGGGGGLYFRTSTASPNTVVAPKLLYEGVVSGDGSTATPWGLNLMSAPWSWGGDAITFHAGVYIFRLVNGNSAEAQVVSIGQTGLTLSSGASITFADGTTQSTAYTGVTCGGDYAESVNVSGDRTSYEPGDVLVLSDDTTTDVAKSVEPYSTSVAGIYSTKPGIVGRRQLNPKLDAEVPMAMVGIVPTKVSAENGPVHRGDLLVTSSTMGYAMKGTNRSRMLGAVVGKAMGSLDSGTGVIEVLVTLQ